MIVCVCVCVCVAVKWRRRRHDETANLLDTWHTWPGLPNIFLFLHFFWAPPAHASPFGPLAATPTSSQVIIKATALLIKEIPLKIKQAPFSKAKPNTRFYLAFPMQPKSNQIIKHGMYVISLSLSLSHPRVNGKLIDVFQLPFYS